MGYLACASYHFYSGAGSYEMNSPSLLETTQLQIDRGRVSGREGELKLIRCRKVSGSKWAAGTAQRNEGPHRQDQQGNDNQFFHDPILLV